MSDAVQRMKERAAEIAFERWSQPIPCADCGEPTGEFERAEVVDWRDADQPYARHRIVHQEPCALNGKWVLA